MAKKHHDETIERIDLHAPVAVDDFHPVDPPLPLLPLGTAVIFRFSDKEEYPALIQGYEFDGSARIWVFSRMSVYRTTATRGPELSQFSLPEQNPNGSTGLSEAPAPPPL